MRTHIDDAQYAQRPGSNGLTPAGRPCHADRITVRRLIVLIPDQGVDGMELAQRIRMLAAPCAIEVALVCVIGSDAHSASAVRLRLATLASLIGDQQVRVTASVLDGQSWIGAVQRMQQPGDIVICCAEHRVPTVANGRQPLYRIFEWLLDIPVYVVAGLYTEPASRSASRRTAPIPARSRRARWLALVAIVAIFVFAQAQISQSTTELAHTSLFIIASLVELGLIVIWSSLA